MPGSFNRVEFTIDNYNNTKVLAFVECTATGISFGQAKRFVFTDYSVPEPSENYERTTIHRDGEVVTHFAFADNLVEQKPPLAQWPGAMSFTREFYDVGLSEPSENYERTTIHRDGEVVTHFAFADNLVEQKPPLAQWPGAMSFTREFYDVGLSEEYLPNPKSDKRTKLVAVQLKRLECKIWFAVVPSLEQDIVNLFEWFDHPKVQCWQLNDSWPVVVIGISNVEDVQGLITIHSVGIDYRVAQ